MLQTADEPEAGQLTAREARARQASSGFGRVLRYIGLIAGIVLGWNLGMILVPNDSGADALGAQLLMSASLGALLFLTLPYLTIGLFAWMRQEIRRVEASDLVAVGIGLLVGGLVSTLLALPIAMLPNPFGQYLPFVAAIAICSVSVMAALTKKQELGELVGVRRVIQELPDLSDDEIQEPELLVDTSAIIDGRIAALAEHGFLPFRLVVPQFVLHELQLVADSSDHNKRSRGVRGLEVLEELRSHAEIQLEVRTIDSSGDDVDAQLVAAARLMGIAVLTGDSNLDRVASLQDVRVLNLHQLAEIMRPSLTTGDEIELNVVQPGREYRQGIGFLTDGTMIVVDEGEDVIGQTARVVITRTLQTSSGRMMFARLASESGTLE